MTFMQLLLLRSCRRKKERRLFIFGFVCFALIIQLSLFSPSHPTPTPLLWSRQSLQKCISSKCLLTRPFSEQQLSVEDATTAFEHIHTYLEDRPDRPPPLPHHFLEQASKSTCAIIGGAPLDESISIQSHSSMVDSTTDLTIRLNVRTPEFLQVEGGSAPLGTHTDVIILQRGSLRSFERYIHGWGEGNETLGQQRREAGERVKENSKPLLIFRPECPSRFRSCPRAWQALEKSSLPSWMDLHILHYGLEILTNKLLIKAVGWRHFRLGSDVPSTGIVSLVAALQMCRRVHAFAFNGSIHGDTDIPKASVWRGHNLKAERTLLRKLSECKKGEFDGLCGKLAIYS